MSNTEKGKLGEEAFTEALSDYPILMNITYGKRLKPILLFSMIPYKIE